MEPIYLGSVPSGLGTPDVYCSVEYNEQPFMLLNLYSEGLSPFCDVIIWQRWIVIGFDDAVYFVSLDQQIKHVYPLYLYFGHLYPTDDALLVASATYLHCFDTNAQQIWVAETVGIDGVVVNKIEGNIIEGKAQYDPPDGWQPFKLSLRTGQEILPLRNKLASIWKRARRWQKI
jgi:hypothetical protein